MAAKKKGNKFKPVTFKLSVRQKRSLEAYCKRHDTTINKFIKSAIGQALQDGRKHHSVKPKIHKGQIDLEDLIDELTKESLHGKSLKLPFPDDLISK